MAMPVGMYASLDEGVILSAPLQALQEQVQRSMDARARADERIKQLAAEKAELEVRFTFLFPSLIALFSLPPHHPPRSYLPLKTHTYIFWLSCLCFHQAELSKLQSQLRASTLSASELPDKLAQACFERDELARKLDVAEAVLQDKV